MASIGNTVKIKNKTALVVDDSKLARYVLKEMLLAQNIKVETAESAEEALGALSAYKPDVIFMDHMMPGMDGFQAVQAIKNDPATATIPIVMYTSKDGGVYVSQARALGAVGVLPKKLRPVELEKVLLQLKLIPNRESPIEQSGPESIPKSIPVTPNIGNTGSSLEEIALSASEELEKDSMRHLFRQLFNEQRDCIKQDQFELTESMAAKITPLLSQPKPKRPIFRFIAAAIAVGIAGTAFWSMAQQSSYNDTRMTQLNAQLAQQKTLLASLSEQIGKINQVTVQSQTQATPTTNGFDLQAFEWALNLNTQIPYQQSINNQKNFDHINDLLKQLQSNNFNGLVSVKYHAGEFCETVSELGKRRLAADDTDISKCQRVPFDSLPATIEDLKDFEQYISLVGLYYSKIDIEFESMGSSYTLQDYPDPSLASDASEWNRIAALNNRFAYELIPAEGSRQASLTIKAATSTQPN